jgi:hypothetical protein
VYINPLAKKVPGISVFCGKTKEEKELDIVLVVCAGTGGDNFTQERPGMQRASHPRNLG